MQLNSVSPAERLQKIKEHASQLGIFEEKNAVLCAFGIRILSDSCKVTEFSFIKIIRIFLLIFYFIFTTQTHQAQTNIFYNILDCNWRTRASSHLLR